MIHVQLWCGQVVISVGVFLCCLFTDMPLQWIVMLCIIVADAWMCIALTRTRRGAAKLFSPCLAGVVASCFIRVLQFN